MKSKLHSFLAAFALFAAGQAYAACVPTAAGFSPSNVTQDVESGGSPIVINSTIELDCAVSDTARIETQFGTTSVYVGGDSSKPIVGIWYKDAGASQQLYGYPLNVTAASTRVNVPIYLQLSGPSNGSFVGTGNYSMSAQITIVVGGTTYTKYLDVTGKVGPICALSPASVDFGSVQTGSKPIVPLNLSLRCTSGVNWTMSQPSIANVGPSGYDNTAWLFSNAAGTIALYDTPVTGTGSGATQTVPTYVGLHGPTRGSATVGTGTVSGAIPVTVTY